MVNAYVCNRKIPKQQFPDKVAKSAEAETKENSEGLT
jgi:hypothetical protein